MRNGEKFSGVLQCGLSSHVRLTSSLYTRFIFIFIYDSAYPLYLQRDLIHYSKGEEEKIVPFRVLHACALLAWLVFKRLRVRKRTIRKEALLLCR